MNTIEVDQVCTDCKGTGLYVSFAEHNGAAIVCYSCKGSGKIHFVHQYESFTERKKTPKTIRRVFEVNPGIGIGENATLHLEDFGGMPVEDWKAGKPFPKHSEDRLHTCPAWWYQAADYDKKPDWETCIPCGSFSDCPHFKDKAFCWKRFDQESK